MQVDKQQKIVKIVTALTKATRSFPPTLTEVVIKKFGKDPFLILISCLLSLRAKDSVTIPICLKLFKIAKTPQQFLDLDISEIEQIIYKVGFYKKKAEQIHYISNLILTMFDGKVPNDKHILINIKGIGVKTANLVLGWAFDIPAICVDTHVHKISNRLGLIKTKTPEETEIALQKILPKKYWILWNTLLVKWGQNICVPISPWCSRCVISDMCFKVGVKKRR